MRQINIVVPVPLHKIDWLIAGIVTMTVFVPPFGMAGWHVQINRLLLNRDCGRNGQNRVRINQLRHRIMITQGDLTIKPGLADADGNPYVTGQYRHRNN